MGKAQPSSERRWLAAVALILTLATVVTWWNLIARGLVPLSGDVLVSSCPRWKLASSAWRSLSIPLWNPYEDMGEPHLADPTAMALYPPFILLSPLGRFGDFLLVWVVVHTAIAAGFMGALVWRRTRDAASTMAGAALAGLGGAFISHVTFPHQIAAAAWLPACLFFQQRRSTLGLAASLAMQWLAGFPPFSLLTVLALAVLALLQGKTSLRATVTAGLIGASLAAPQAVPFLELLAHSSRRLFLDPSAVGTFSLTCPALLKELFLPQWSLLAPRLPGDPSMMTFYAGPIALLLAALAVVRGGRAERLLAGGSGVAFLLCLGVHLPFYGAFLPFHIFRFPANWLFLATAGIAVLVAMGVARIGSGKARWAMALAMVADLAAFGYHLEVGWAEPALFSDPPPLAAALRPGPGGEPPPRLFHSEGLLRAWLAQGFETPEDYAPLRDFLFPSFGTAFGVYEAKSYQVMRLRRAVEFQRRIDREGPGSLPARWADVGLFVANDPEGRRVDRRSVRVMTEEGANGRVFLQPPSAGVVTIRSYLAGRVDVSVQASTDATLVFDEVSYPGWRATVDGTPAKLGLFADTFMAVPMDRGRHEVTFRYVPASFLGGVAAAALTVIVLAGARATRRWRRPTGSALG